MAIPGARRRFAAGGAYAPSAAAQRGLCRAADDGLEGYEIWVGVDGAPDLAGPPDQVESALPFEVELPLPGAGTTAAYRIVVRRRNRWNLSSRNAGSGGPPDRSSFAVQIDEDGAIVAAPPSPPRHVRADPAAAGAVRVRAEYAYAADGPATAAGGQADTWALWVTDDGSDPDPDADEADATAAMAKADGVARLDWTSEPFADGATVKVVVRTRRTGPPVTDSTNADAVSAIANTDGPEAPGGDAGLGAYFGADARQH